LNSRGRLELETASAFQPEAAIVEKSDPRAQKHLYRSETKKSDRIVAAAIEA